MFMLMEEVHVDFWPFSDRGKQKGESPAVIEIKFNIARIFKSY